MFVIVGSGYCLLRQARKTEVRETQTIRSDPARALDSGAGRRIAALGTKMKMKSLGEKTQGCQRDISIVFEEFLRWKHVHLKGGSTGFFRRGYFPSFINLVIFEALFKSLPCFQCS